MTFGLYLSLRALWQEQISEDETRSKDITQVHTTHKEGVHLSWNSPWEEDSGKIPVKNIHVSYKFYVIR